MKFNSFILLVISLCFASCSINRNTNSIMDKTIMEVTTFKVNSGINPMTFATRDLQVESDFTNKQKGFIKRQSAVDENGNYVVIVYWKSIEDATASMNKFMTDTSVGDYAKMIDASTMKMSRFMIDKPFDADKSQFVEIMTYDVIPGTDMSKFKEINYKVEKDFSSKRNGFLQRLVGFNEEGRQVVAVYWDSKENSDLSIKPFMEASISQQFMQLMNQSTMFMGRYKFLSSN